MKKPNNLVNYVYYIDEQEIINAKKDGYTIYHLPEQDYYNDLRFRMNLTNTHSKLFKLNENSTE